MTDVNANIGIHIDSSAALASLKELQRQLATFHGSVAKSSAASVAAQKALQQNLLNAINATGQFHAQMGLVRTSTESFTHALENNKLSMREYFRYAGASTRSFGKLFKAEFDTIGKVAEERVRKMQTQYIKMGRDANGAMQAMSVTPTTLNMKDLGNQTAVAAQKQALFNQLIRQGSTSLLNFGKNTQWAGRQLMVGFSVPLMYIGSIASKTFMEMEEQAIRFKRVYGDMFTTSEETDKAIKGIELLAKSFTKYGVAVTDTMKMAADAAAMGKTGAELTAQVSEATRLAVLGGVEQQQSLETTISLTNAFGISADQLASKINFLNAVENQTVVSIEDLTIAIPKAGPVIKQLGGDVEDLAFFLTAMKEGGINASEGANALKSGLASLINPSKKAAEMLMGLGVNINGIVEANAGDVRNTVIGFAQALDTLDPLNRSRAIEQLFGKFQFARLSTLFQNITKDGTQASKVLGLTQASVEELAIMSERELKRVEDAVGVNFKQAVEDLKVSIMPIGKAFLEALTPIVKFAAELLKKFDGLGDGTKKFIVVATTLVGILGPTLLMTFGLVANGAANIVKLFLALRTGFLKLGGNTTVLSQQTSYLNAEQLEAATVAASLNQAHTRLTQSFTLEASAVHALRSAYVQATTAALMFSRANPGMMMPGFKGVTPKKFARGATYVPGTGNKDTVPSVLTPGEAVIPKDVAQNPAYKPIIDAMVNGNLQAFKKGTTSAGDDYSHVGDAKTTSIDDLLLDPRLTPLEKNNLRAYKQILLSQGKKPELNTYGGLAYSFDPVLNRLMAKGKAGAPISDFEKAWTARGADKWLASGMSPAEAQIIDDLILENIKKSGISRVSDADIETAFRSLPKEVKITPEYVKMAERLDRVESYSIGSGLGSTPKTSREILETAKNTIDPDTGKPYIADYEITTYVSEKSGKEQTSSIVVSNNDGTKSNLGRGSRAGRYYVSEKVKQSSVLEDKITDKSNEKDIKIFEETDKEVKASRFKDEPVTKLGTRVQATTGWSFKEANHIGGIYQNPDGSRVFVKPMMTEAIALAEMRGTEIGRRVGLQTPEQKLRVIEDPTTGRKLFALESPYSEKFDPATIPTTFSEDDYFKQIVAAGVRGDTDLKKGNLGGSVLTDVGRSGVLNKASGMRYLTMDVPSLKEIAEKNLSGVTGDYAGNSPRWFGNVTADIPKNMTPDVYHEKMMAEINRQEKIIEQALEDFALTPEERPYYENMLRRLREGKGVNWRELHKKHTSIVIKPDELIEDVKTGKLEKPKTTRKPSDVKSSSKNPKDTKITPAPKKGKRVVQNPKAPRTRVTRPGFADAGISQSEALANLGIKPNTSGMKIEMPPTGLSDAEFKKQFEALNKEAKNTTGRFKDLANKSNIAAGAISGLTMMAAFSGGKLGEMATAAMPFVFGIQGIVALLPLMKNPWIAAISAVVALGVGMMMLVDNAKKMAQKEADYINSISATTNKMKKIGEITDKFGASEIMAKRRADFLPTFNSKPVTREGQQFGTNFMGSEVGKEISKGFSDSLLADRSTAVKQFALQLSSYVSDGVIDGVQAGDIARQIAIDFEDMSLYPSIIGQLTSIIGPDGIDILKDPIKVRLEIINQESIAAEIAADQIVPNQPTEGGFNSVKSGVKDFGFGFVKDYLVGSDATNKTAAAASALSNQALSSAKAQADATQVQYEKDLQVLEAKKAIAKTEKERKVAQGEIDTLTGTNKENTIKLREEVERLLKAQQDAFNKTSPKNQGSEFSVFGLFNIPAPNPAQKAFIEAGRKQVVTKFKGGNLEDSANAMLAQSKKLESKNLEVRINAIAQTGTNPTNLSALMKMFNGKEGTLNKQLDIAVKTRGIDDTVSMLGQLAFVKEEDLKKELFIGINAIEDETTYTGVLKTLSELAEIDGKDFNVTAILKTEGVPGLIKLQEKLAKLEGLPEPITKTTQLENIGLPQGALDAISAEWEYFMSLPEEVRKRAITSYISTYELSGEAATQAKIAAAGGGQTQEDYWRSPLGQAKIKADAALAATTPRYKPGMPDPIKPPPDPLDPLDQNGNRDTTLDELLKKLKFVRDASIDAEGKLSYLMKIVSGDGIKKFAGVSQQLMSGTKGGFNRDFISMLESMDNKTRSIYMTVKKGKVVLTEQGVALKAAFNEAAVGSFHDAQIRVVQDSVAQDAAFKKLKAAGIDTATALEMTADAGLAVSINAKKIDKAKMLEMAAAAKAAKDETLGLDRALTSVISNSQTELDKANEDLKTLTEAREKFNYSAEDLKIIGDNPALLNSVKKMLDSNTTKPAIDKLKKDIALGLSNIKTTVKVNANISDLKRSIEEIASSVQSIFDRAMSNMQKIIAETEAGIAIKWDPIIADADKAVADIQATIDDKITIDPATGAVTKVEDGLQTIFNKASEKVDAQNKLYDDAVKGIEDAYTTDTAGFVQKIKDLNGEIKKIQDAKDINMGSKISVAMAFGDSLGGLDTNALSLEGAEKFVADTQVRIQEQFSRPIEMFQQEIASYNRTIETQYTRAVEKIQKEIEGIQRKISIDFELPLSDMQDESSRLSEDLAVMDKITESINDKYKVQEDALTKVAELNQDIVEQQKQQLGLADALSKGDISAAAAAAQDMRATQAAKSLGAQQGTLGKAKEAELAAVKSSSGLTRDQISERQYAIERASYELQVRRAVLEDDIKNKQEAIYKIENNPDRLKIITEIERIEDEIYKKELARQTANNALYLIQTQIEAKNAAIAVQQAAITAEEDKIKEKQDAREAALKTAEAAHKTAMVDLNTALTDAETKLKAAQTALAKAQAEADAIRKAKDKEIADATEAMKAEFAAIEAGLKAAEAAALKFTTQLELAQGAAKTLAALYADAIQKQTEADAKKLADEKKELADREAADKKILADRIAAAKAKVTAAETALANAIDNQESSTIISGLKAKLEEAKKAYALSPEGIMEANAKFVAPTPTLNPTQTTGTTGPRGTYTEGLFLNPQLKGMNPETIAAILKGMGYYNYGGLIPKMFAAGGFSKGTDTVPAMLTPGEFVIRKAAVDKYGVETFKDLNMQRFAIGGEVTGGKSKTKNKNKDGNWFSRFNPANVISLMLSGMFNFGASQQINKDVNLKSTITQQAKDLALLQTAQMLSGYTSAFNLKNNTSPEIFGNKKLGALADILGVLPVVGLGVKSISKIGSKGLINATVANTPASPIFKPEIIEGGSSNYKAFTIGEDSTKFTFKGLEKGKGQGYGSIKNSDMSGVSDSIVTVPTTPQGLIEAALKLNPNDKSLLSLLNNFKAKQYGPAETELLDFMVASSYINKSNQVSSQIDTDGLALVIAHLSGDKNATSLLNNKKTILNEILAKDKAGAKTEAPPSFQFDGPLDTNKVPVIHSTDHALNYDKNGNIVVHPAGYYRVGEGQLPRGEGTIEAANAGVERSTVHTSLYGTVASHLFGQWSPANKKIVSALKGMIDANGNPYSLNPIDTWWSKSPGESLVFPKETTSVINPFTDEIAYAKELIGRGIIKEGDRVPVMAADPKSKDILHLTKEKYTDDELQEIADLVRKDTGNRLTVQDGKLLTEATSFGQTRFDELATPGEYLDRMALQLAKEQLGMKSGPIFVDGHGLSSNYANNEITAIAQDLGIPQLNHTGSSPSMREAPTDFGTPYLKRADLGYSYGDPVTIDSLRFNALAGTYKTPKVDKYKELFDDEGFSMSDLGIPDASNSEPITIADLEPYLNPTDFAASKIPTPTVNTPNIPTSIMGPSLASNINAFNNNDTPIPPKIIKSTISAGKLKQLQKFIDPDLMMASGGLVPGFGNKDTISSMLTPGEFVIKKSAVDAFGASNLAKINDGTSTDSSVYNYSLSVNVNGNNLNADDIASTVMQKIKYIDGQRIRGQR